MSVASDLWYLSTFVQAQIFNSVGSCRCRLIRICGNAVTIVQAQFFNCAGSCRFRYPRTCGIAVYNCLGTIVQVCKFMWMSLASDLW